MPVTVVTVVTLDTGIFFFLLRTGWIAVTASQFQKQLLPMKFKITRGIPIHPQAGELVVVTPVTLPLNC
jgi:hypothetical protein